MKGIKFNKRPLMKTKAIHLPVNPVKEWAKIEEAPVVEQDIEEVPEVKEEPQEEKKQVKKGKKVEAKTEEEPKEESKTEE